MKMALKEGGYRFYAKTEPGWLGFCLDHPALRVRPGLGSQSLNGYGLKSW
jgi:hypothetical protein